MGGKSSHAKMQRCQGGDTVHYSNILRLVSLASCVNPTDLSVHEFMSSDSFSSLSSFSQSVKSV